MANGTEAPDQQNSVISTHSIVDILQLAAPAPIPTPRLPGHSLLIPALALETRRTFAEEHDSHAPSQREPQ